LKKDSKVGNKKSSFSSNENIDVSEMEREIDEILSGDKNKLNEIDLKNPNRKKILSETEERKVVPPIKEKLKENADNNEKPKITSKKIIADARKNLGKKPLKKDENAEVPCEKSEKIKIKRHIRLRFGKKKIKPIEKISDKQPEKLTEKHFYFGDRKSSRVKQKKKKNEETTDLSSSSPDDLVEFEFNKKYERHLIPPGIDSVETDNTSFLDKEIGETLPSNDEVDSDKIGREIKIGEYEKKERSLWRKKNPKVEEIKDKEDESEPESLINKFGFRVDNLPGSDAVSEDEAKLLDEKIKETPTTDDTQKKKDVAELKALKLADEHIKEEMITDEKKGKHLEHIFFDEESSSEGWSPKVTEKEKKDMSLPLSTRQEIKSEDIEEGEIKTNEDIELPKEVLQLKSIKLADLGFSESEWEELDFYPLKEHFSYVEILREKESLDKRYFLVEVELTPDEQKALDFIIETIGNFGIDAAELETQGKDKYLMIKVGQVIKEYDIKLGNESFDKIIYHLEKRAIGLEKIDPLMKDPNIEDISCDGANVPLFLYHRTYGSLKSNVEFKSEDELSSFVFKLAQKCGKHISIAEPMLDATMPDGSRIQMTLSDEITTRGSTFTIRKFREDPFSPPDLIEFNTMSAEMVAYMWIVVENGINALIAGGTAAGKTTVLNALSLFIPRESKIVSIEETREMNLPHPNWIPGVARSGFGEVVADKMVGEIDLYDLMKAALRQRPEYIIVGEIRGKEAYVLFQAMATGHATYSTVHADSAQSLIHRLEGKPINIPRVMLQSLDVVTLHVITRVKNKRARRCKQIIEIIDIDPTTKEILTNEVFRWDPVEDNFIYSGKSYVLERVRTEKDMSREEMTNELRNRKEIIEWMNAKNIREFREVANVVSRYAENPAEVMKRIEEDTKQ